MRARVLPFGLVPPILLLLASCTPVGAGTVAGILGGSVILFHRTPVDIVVSAATARDCSVVHLDRGEHYCRPKEPPPEPPVFCTRSLGVPDCWADPARLANQPRELADGPRSLTPAQDADRRNRFRGLW